MNTSANVTASTTPLFRIFASRLAAIRNLDAMMNPLPPGTAHAMEMHQERIDELLSDHMPRGAGFDTGTRILSMSCTAQKMTFRTSFHHMNDVGMYDGWTEHDVIVTPAFDGFDIRVTGRNRNDIKEHVAQSFHDALTLEVVE